jgi:serine/threonine protein kinase
MPTILDLFKKARKRHTGLSDDKGGKSNLHSHPSLHPNQSESSRVTGSSSDNEVSPGTSEVSNHHSESLHDVPLGEAAAKAVHTPPPSALLAASLSPPQHNIRDDAEPMVGLTAVRSSTWRYRTFYEKLRDSVTQKMRKYKIGFELIGNYLPEEEQQQLVTEARIREVFQEASEDLVAYITSQAPKTFLITLLTIQNVNEGLSAMQAFHYHKFTDEHCLPVERMTDKRMCMREWESDQWDCDTCPLDEDDVSRPSNTACPHGSELSAFHHSCWNLTDCNNFYDKQWQFSLQKFSTREFDYESIEDERILPFELDDETRERTGNFSDVKKAWMLANHLLLPSNPENDTSDPATLSPLIPCQSQDGRGRIKVAIKTLKAMSQVHYNIHHEWKREAEAYKALNSLRHPHIVKGLAAFRQRYKYHLLLEWANGGSLQTFWNAKPRRTLTRDNLEELLEQLHGLADALHNMHNTKIARSRRSSNRSRRSSLSSRTEASGHESDNIGEEGRVRFAAKPDIVPPLPLIPSIRVDGPASTPLSPVPTIQIEPPVEGSSGGDGLETAIDDSMSDSSQVENWRHGDIKPDNILRFIEQEEAENERNFKLGTLKLADLGRAKRHMNVTIERGDIEIDKWHTKKYEPPDIFINQDSQTTSRLYDIWSLGCVFFEAVVWILYGHTEVTNFELTTTKRETEGTPYWTRNRESAGVSQMAGLWMSSILQDDPECMGPKPSAIADLMRLIQRKMLVVKLPPRSDEYTQGCRTNAEDVFEEMTAILKKAKSDEEYLFTGRSRKGIKPPPSGDRADQKLNAVSQRGLVATRINNNNNNNNNKDLGSSLAPPRANASQTHLRRQIQYTHSLSDAWVYENDDAFVKATLNKLCPKGWADTELFYKAKSKLCGSCSTFDPSAVESFEKRPLRKLVATQRSCDLCRLILNQATDAGIAKSATVGVDRQGGRLRINGNDDTALRICRSPGELAAPN